MSNSSDGSMPIWLVDGFCQFGKHGEPFLWNGSRNDDVDIAIMNLINLATDDLQMALDACEYIDACLADSKSKQDKK
jgi:hypothetical protein